MSNEQLETFMLMSSRKNYESNLKQCRNKTPLENRFNY